MNKVTHKFLFVNKMTNALSVVVHAEDEKDARKLLQERLDEVEALGFKMPEAFTWVLSGNVR